MTAPAAARPEPSGGVESGYLRRASSRLRSRWSAQSSDRSRRQSAKVAVELPLWMMIGVVIA
jgi:hypothetical protein